MRLSFAIPSACAVIATVTALSAQERPGPGLSALPEVEFSQLSQRDPTPLGEKALSIRPEQWKHGETEHFIYHFVHTYVATRVSVEAEFHYGVVAKELQRDQPAGNTKSHIYIFEEPEDWAQFREFGRLEPWTGGIYSAGSLFIQRNPAMKFSGNELGHEVVHLVLDRFYSGGIPSWLNEGMAQYISKGAHASYQRARGYLATPRSDAIAPEALIPVSRLIALTSPPSGEARTFYDQSERLVRFLAATDKRSFLTLFDALARHEPFETAFAATYLGHFSTPAVFEQKFREYASKDFGTSLRQARTD